VESKITREIIAGLESKNLLPAFRVDLKVNCRAALTKNFDVCHGWVNGKPVVVERLSNDPDFVVIHSKKNKSWKIQVAPEKSRVRFANETHQYYRWQIPLELGYGLTIHKSQGQTLNPAVIYADHFFGSGMGYTACSRAPSLEALFFLALPPSKQAFSVFPEVLQLLIWFDDYDVLNGWDERQRRRTLPKVPVNYPTVGAHLNPALAEEARKFLEEREADMNDYRIAGDDLQKEKMEIYNRRHRQLNPSNVHLGDGPESAPEMTDEQVEIDDILETVLFKHPSPELVREIPVVLQKLRLIPLPASPASLGEVNEYVSACEKVSQKEPFCAAVRQ